MCCEKCGKEIPEGARFCDECKTKPQNMTTKYVSVFLSVLGVALPFFKWLEIPMAQGLYSMFGMGEQTPGFSLFGYLFAGGQYQTDTVYLVMAVLVLIAVIGIVFNAIYAVKVLKNKPKCYKYGTIGAIILTIMSVLFIIIISLVSVMLNVIKLSVAPYITAVVSIANIVLVRKFRKQSKGDLQC